MMLMYGNENYNHRLQALESEEAVLERRLNEFSNSLDSGEAHEINNRLTAIRVEKQEIEQLTSGAFF